MPEVHIPPRYRGPTQGAHCVEVAGDTVRECIEAVDARHPGFGELVFDAKGKIRIYATVFVNGEELDRSAGDTKVAADDRIDILAAVAGG